MVSEQRERHVFTCEEEKKSRFYINMKRDVHNITFRNESTWWLQQEMLA